MERYDALASIRELSSYVSGPYAGMLLAASGRRHRDRTAGDRRSVSRPASPPDQRARARGLDKLRALAVTSAGRLGALPDVPTFA
jgi:hypothetical protein